MDTTYNMSDVISMFITWFIPVAVSYLLDTWSTLQNAISGWSNLGKRIFYIALVVVGMLILYAFRNFLTGTDSNMIHVIIRGIIAGLAGTIIYKLARDKAKTA